MTDSVLAVGGHELPRGQTTMLVLPVTTGLNGSQQSIHVHAAHGATEGPVLVLLSTLHGGEWFSIPPLRRLLAETEPARLRGTLLIVPVANPSALALGSRNMPDESDSPDLNRIFPGPLSWTSDQLVATITNQVLANADALLDFHMGSWGSTFRDILIGDDQPDPAVSDEAERLALAFGSPIIRRSNVVTGFPGPRSSIGYAGGVLGIPALGVEVGGPGFGPTLEQGWKADMIRGVRAVMGAMGMIDGAPDARPARQLIYRKSHRVNPSIGGYLRSLHGGESLGRAVRRGTLLGEVVSPYTFEVLEQLQSPVDGCLFYTARDYMVRPGDWAYGVADTEDPGVRWIDNNVRQDGVSR